MTDWAGAAAFQGSNDEVRSGGCLLQFNTNLSVRNKKIVLNEAKLIN